MEEGELEPEPQTEPRKVPFTDSSGQADGDQPSCDDKENGSNSVSGFCLREYVSSSGEKSKFEYVVSRGVTGSIEVEVDQVIGALVHHGSKENRELAGKLDMEIKEQGDGLVKEHGNVQTFEDALAKENKGRVSDESSFKQGPLLELLIEEQLLEDNAAENVSVSSSEVKMDLREGHSGKVEIDGAEKDEVVFDLDVGQNDGRGISLEAEDRETTAIDLEADQLGMKCIDLEADTKATDNFSSSKEAAIENDLSLMLMTDCVKDNQQEKGKGIAISFSRSADFVDEDAVEGPNIGVFHLDLKSQVALTEKAGGAMLSNGPLDLSLSLPNVLPDQSKSPLNSHPNSPCPSGSIQSFPSSFQTLSDGFTNSMSFSSYQPFVQKPSCSLTQNSMENYEQSVGSHRIFQGVDQHSTGTIWQAQTSNEPKRKGAGALFQRALLNRNSSQKSLQGLNGHHYSNSGGVLRQLTPAHSLGSHDTSSDYKKDKRIKTVESSNNLFMSKQPELERLVVNGQGLAERIISGLVSEPLQVTSKVLQDMTEYSVAYMKEAISKMLTDEDKHGQIHVLQEALQRRSDLTMETMQRCSRSMLEIMVAVKTGLPDFLQKTNNASSSDLIEIYHNLKCRNLSCRSILPVDDCDCKICSQKNGFCSACMCLVCSKFDMAYNTCCWVGCDVCLHWCHTECGLRNCHIRNGLSSNGVPGATEMQFHCVACGHPSEMYGFVKEVFRTCSKGWKVEILARELRYISRIFSASIDVRGKNLCHIADRMLMKLEDKTKHNEVIDCVMTFLSQSESNSINVPGYTPSEPCGTNSKISNVLEQSSKETKWLQPFSLGKVSHIAQTSAASSMDGRWMCEQRGDTGIWIKHENKPIVDELDSVVRFKQAEAKMYQERADHARREAEGLKRIVAAKNDKIEEEFTSAITRLQLQQAEDRHRKKFEELQAMERVNHNFNNMKARMEAEIKDLLMKMEIIKHNFSA
ncbi:hypothetical protein HPP92_020379 [Vanilla planifolia]|uniref:Protein OBERON 4 n=1 Tax=Vanilla planifolia TaxID=51239 RepID=A0A835Q4Z1_VANPL|nr:hypothetical protein HPP92_020379 [Vanilla planifolia]